jgi:hypothetical protein
MTGPAKSAGARVDTGMDTGMEIRATRRGGVPVGHLAELPQVEAGAVVCLRLWCDGAEGQARLWTDMAAALGAGPARDALQALERLVGQIARNGRRPLMRHGRACACVGADEAAFATMVATAAEGEREDAVLLAALLVAPALAAEVAELAGVVGQALRHMSLCTAPAAVAAPHPDRLH